MLAEILPPGFVVAEQTHEGDNSGDRHSHLVVNVDSFVQEDENFIKKVHSLGLPYEPKWGKGTKGFKVSNIWIGNEYFELVKIKSKDGGGWIES